jgi:hypothetical protein
MLTVKGFPVELASDLPLSWATIDLLIVLFFGQGLDLGNKRIGMAYFGALWSAMYLDCVSLTALPANSRRAPREGAVGSGNLDRIETTSLANRAGATR